MKLICKTTTIKEEYDFATKEELKERIEEYLKTEGLQYIHCGINELTYSFITLYWEDGYGKKI